MRYLFENYAFDTDRRELHRGSDVVAVAPKVFDLLDFLIRNRDRVVSKDDLINEIWNGRSVSDAALTTRLNAARSAIGDSGQEQRLDQNTAAKGLPFRRTHRCKRKGPLVRRSPTKVKQNIRNPSLRFPTNLPSLCYLFRI